MRNTWYVPLSPIYIKCFSLIHCLRHFCVYCQWQNCVFWCFRPLTHTILLFYAKTKDFVWCCSNSQTVLPKSTSKMNFPHFLRWKIYFEWFDDIVMLFAYISSHICRKQWFKQVLFMISQETVLFQTVDWSNLAGLIQLFLSETLAWSASSRCK